MSWGAIQLWKGLAVYFKLSSRWENDHTTLYQEIYLAMLYLDMTKTQLTQRHLIFPKSLDEYSSLKYLEGGWIAVIREGGNKASWDRGQIGIKWGPSHVI